MKDRIAVVGDLSTILGFRALGLETVPVKSAEEAGKALRALEDCAIIYLTEQLAQDMAETLARYKDALRPAVILIPGREGSLGIGKEHIEGAIKRAIGTDL